MVFTHIHHKSLLDSNHGKGKEFDRLFLFPAGFGTISKAPAAGRPDGVGHTPKNGKGVTDMSEQNQNFQEENNGTYRYWSGEKTYTSAAGNPAGGSQAEGSRATGSQTEGGQTAGSQATGSRATGSQTAGYQGSGSQAEGPGQPYNGQSYQNPYRSGAAYGGSASYGGRSSESGTAYGGPSYGAGGRPPKKPKKRIPWGKVVGIPVAVLLVCAVIGGAAWGISRLAASGEETQVAENTTEAATQSEPVVPTSQVTPSGDASASVVDVSDVVEANMSAMVSITTTEVYDNYNYYYNYFFGGSGGQQEVTGAGSGVIIGDNGSELWIVTNNHVVSGADSVKVTFVDGSTVDAYVKGVDEQHDVGMVGVSLSSMSQETVDSITKVTMGDSDSLRLGEGVIAIGNALGLGQSVSTGVVSALDRDVTTSNSAMEGLIQTDAAINPGNSGGALLDMEGNLIGINVAKTAETDVEGMGFAIPISQVKDIIEELTTEEPREQVPEDQYPYLGVQLKNLDSNFASMYGMPSGILVYGVEEGSPAEAGGMHAQDIITAFEGHSVSNYDDLNEQLAYYAGGTTVTITVQRLENGQYVEHELTVTLGLKSDYQTQE